MPLSSIFVIISIPLLLNDKEDALNLCHVCSTPYKEA